MAKDLDGKANAAASSASGQQPNPRAALLWSLVLGLLLGWVAVVMFPAAQHLRSFQDGERAQATMHTSGTCMLGRCKVEFEADGRTVVADLPVGSGAGKRSVGDPLTIRHRADDPRTVALEGDLWGGGAAVVTVLFGGAALLFLMMAAVAAFFVVRERRGRPAPGRTPQDGQEPGGHAGPSDTAAR
ncbi:DUF3592 domain-containing protein [Streptomyces sp. NPDC059452]|uniref:DUF3592 domain-containing protein n=1 Tax=Streptomyces sp. NPDC059452 TaxID=3346835 RepID=UPI0036AB1B1E